MQICWTGTYIPLHGLEKVIQAMKAVQERSCLPIKLLLWGPNEIAARPYSDLIKSLDLEERIEIHSEWGNLKAWESYIEDNCDLFLGVFGDSDKAKYVMPNKVIDGMAFRIPVLTAHSTGTEEFCNGENDIFIVDNTPECIAEKIIQIAEMPFEEIDRRVKKSYSIYEKNFSADSFNDRFISVINDIEKKWQ